MQKIKREELYNYIMLHKWPYWASALIVGLVAVSYTKIISLSESFANHIYQSTPEYLFFITPLFFLVSWALVHFLAPEAKGSGIPQVMAAVEIIEKNHQPEKVEKLLGIKIAIVKILSSVIALLGGGAIGREGPTLQISASIFYFASKRINIFKKYITVETWIITGAAAGLAAAFNTPLGGLVYAIEELATQHLNKFKSSLITAVIISGFASQMISGPYLYLGYPKILPMEMELIPTVVIISILCGMLGALFGKIIFNLAKLKTQYINSAKLLALVSIFCGLLTAAIIYFVDHRFMGSGKELLLSLLFTEEKSELHVTVLRFFAPILTYISGGAGGIFAPSLAAGGSIGNYIATLASSSNSNLCTLLGMIAFLTGVTRAPFTAFILVLEMTDRHSSIFPMMLAAVLANNFAKIFGEKSFYDLIKETYLPEKDTK